MGIDIAAERAIKAKKEAASAKKAQPAAQKKNASGVKKQVSTQPVISCSTCKTGTMEATKIAKFGGVLRFIGYLIAIPSVLGVLFAVITFFSFGVATSDSLSSAASEAEKAGVAIGAGLGFGFALFIGGSSLIGGLIGWFLLMKKKVFKCLSCGFILDRA